MTSEVASAAVALLPTFKGNARELERVMGPAIDRAGVAGGAAYGASFASSFQRAIGPLSIAAFAGAAIAKGIGRFKAIDEASAKLRGLGNDAASVQRIMDSALRSVQGTAYTLGDAATIAASALAAGVKQGADLDRYLKLVVDTAAVTGQELSNVGSTLNTVRTLNAAYNDSLQTLSEKGLPVYEQIASKLGVTTAEVKKLASQGQITADVLENVLGASVGGVAQEMGTTLTSRVDNLLTSVGRLGEAFVSSGLEEGKDSLTSLTEIMDELKPAAQVLGSALGGAVSVLNAIPAPVYAAAAAALLLNKHAGAVSATSLKAASSLRILATSAGGARVMVAGAGGEIVSTTARMNLLRSTVGRIGPAMLGALGGPVGLAVGGLSIALGGLVAAWQQTEAAAQAQKAAIDEITASLDQNTGAVTDNTYATLAKQLQDSGVLDKMEELGLSVEGVGKAVAEGGPGLDTLRSKLQGIIDLNWAQSYNGQSYLTQTGQAALEVLGALTTKSKDQASAVRQLQQALKASGDETVKSTNAFESMGDAIDAAFDALSRVGAQTSAVAALTDSIAENGKAIDATSRGGVANLDALQKTIQAMAENAGTDYELFVRNVGAMMTYLDKQGVNTQNVMGAVRASIQNVAGKNWSVYLNGGQLIGEADRIVKALKILVEAQAAADGSDRRLYQRQIDELNLKLKDIRSVTSSFRGASSASDSASSGYKRVGSSAKKTKADLAALRKEVYLLAKDWLKPSPYSSEAVSLIDQINSAYKEGAVSKKNRASLITSVKRTDKELTRIARAREKQAELIDDANQKVADAIAARDTYRQSIIDGFKNLGDISKFAAETQKTITEVYTQGDRLVSVVKQVTSKGSASDMLEGLRKQVDEASKFKEAFNDLKKLGLNDTSLQNLMGEFLSSGDSSIATSLLNGGKSAISEVNDLMKQLGDLTGSETKGWAKDVADSMYQAGISTAEGFLKGLQSQDSKLKSQYDKMANDLLTTIKRKLGIKSPSREMGKLAEYTSQGWNNNLHLDPVTPGVSVDDVLARRGGGDLVVWVENPWTGEQVRAHTIDVARGQMAVASREKIAMRRGGNR